ncbi:hypothetical protein IPJ72_02360 [Candidatus Peregrinibacteria bacterium]|nr:MAG: hypothetical protein IPJ72_02360 [Candidatus Peregrinibacteria bacterium]
MELLTQWLIAVALAMDSFSVSIAAGAGLPHVKPKHSLWMAGYFGFFKEP